MLGLINCGCSALNLTDTFTMGSLQTQYIVYICVYIHIYIHIHTIVIIKEETELEKEHRINFKGSRSARMI